MMKVIVHLLGQPGDHLQSAAKSTWQYFRREQGSISPGRRLKSPDEYKARTGVEPQVSWRVFDMARNLNDPIQRPEECRRHTVERDKMQFAFCFMDAKKRITSSEP